jgi:putative tryptophan/tyrosine transport system substrate-binding protein
MRTAIVTVQTRGASDLVYFLPIWVGLRVLAGLAAAVSCCAFAASNAPERLVLYPDLDLPQARKAFERFQQAIVAEGLDTRFGVKTEFVPLAGTDTKAIEAGLRQAIDRKPAAIIGTSGAVVGVAKRLTQTIPVLFASNPDVVQSGLVQSYAKPGGNLTGFTFYLPADDKRLEILKEAVPGLKRVGVLTDRFWAQEEFSKTLSATGYVRHGIHFKMVVVDNPDALRALLNDKEIRELDAWYVPHHFFSARFGSDIVKALNSTKKPVMYSRTKMVENGGLMAYQHDIKGPHAIWAGMLAMIFSGVPPGEIPVERAKDFELSINVTTANALGIVLPKSILRRADVSH